MGTAISSSVDAPSPQDFGEIFKFIGGYRISQAIYVVVEIGIPDALAAGPRTCDELAAETKTNSPTLIEFSASSPERACSTRLVPTSSS